ncbi:GroES-like protein [Aspergillus steynii IBT 23096]|uniref:GroES-like protein n=1 Tax=Aspergillus steynii IBT 23096 TaxID=1392250 RepID=A0A2I2FWP8_9EURO|nr:GroES-like protein [Aspergillus steynii IBT 23096]PLB45063.1 GroES-like protein [Aspergillus steynii IBT 23096]
MSTQKKALFATENAEFVVREDICHEDLADNELLIEVHYSGINPADIKHSTLLGIRSTVIGYDFAGRVITPPRVPSVSTFNEGDIVAGYTPSGLDRPSKYGAHQDYLVVPDDMVFKVPSNLPEQHAAALTCVVMTAADAIHNLFKYPLPTSAGTSTSPILIWGASSSVGISALQLARASGVQNIFVTASPARHDLLKSLGATHVFDYRSSTVVADIKAAVEALGQGLVTHAFDAAGSSGAPSSADLLSQSVTDSTELASVVLRQDKRFRMPVAMTKDPWAIHPPGAPHPISLPSRPTDHWNAWKAVNWAIENYSRGFEMVSVDVVEGTAEESLEEVWKVSNGERGFGKVVLRHPFK